MCQISILSASHNQRWSEMSFLIKEKQLLFHLLCVLDAVFLCTSSCSQQLYMYTPCDLQEGERVRPGRGGHVTETVGLFLIIEPCIFSLAIHLVLPGLPGASSHPTPKASSGQGGRDNSTCRSLSGLGRYRWGLIDKLSLSGRMRERGPR